MDTQLTNELVDAADREERGLDAAARQRGLSRRRLLQLAAAAIPLSSGAVRLAQGVPSAFAAGPIVKPLPPEWFINYGTNAEMRWDAAGDIGYTVPNERFFVRDHTATPIIDLSTWSLSVFGSGLKGQPDVDHAVNFSYDELTSLPCREVTAFVECAGNGRSFFGTQQGTPAAGTQWQLGAVGVARWKGVPLREVLERAGIRRGAVDVMPSGLDSTVLINGVDSGHVRRPIPVAKAFHDAILAYEMNGEQLPPDHGFPLRLIVPGWVGVASIKWVGQIEVANTTLSSPFNTTLYRLTGPDYPVDQPALTKQAIKSAFELPLNAQLPVGRPQLLVGRSWSGNAAIKRVDVSLDGGVHWKRARLFGPNLPNAWARWTIPWTPRATGPYQLLARATDRAHVSQPDTVPFNTGGYLFWAVVKHPVTVV